MCHPRMMLMILLLCSEDSFEKAYVQYRVSDNTGALETLEKLDASEARVMELKAQIHYRLENFQVRL